MNLTDREKIILDLLNNPYALAKIKAILDPPKALDQITGPIQGLWVTTTGGIDAIVTSEEVDEDGYAWVLCMDAHLSPTTVACYKADGLGVMEEYAPHVFEKRRRNVLPLKRG